MSRIPVNIKRLLIIILISFIVIGAFIFFTADKRTLVSFKELNKNFILLAFLFYFLEYTFDSLRTKILLKGTGNIISLFECYKLVALQVFFDLITPFSFGGQPFQIYVLHKKKVPVGNATTVVFIKLFFGAIALLAIVIYSMLFYSDIFISIPFFKTMINITGFLFLFMILLFLWIIYNPKMEIIISKTLTVLNKFRIVRHPVKWHNRINNGLLQSRKAFSGFMSHKFYYFFIGFILSFLMIMSMILMILCFIWGFHLNSKLNLGQGIAITSALITITTFMPTPGTSGLGEGIFYLLYQNYIPKYLIGIIMFLWRFFSQYLSAFLGVIVTAHYSMELLSKKKLPGR